MENSLFSSSSVATTHETLTLTVPISRSNVAQPSARNGRTSIQLNAVADLGAKFHRFFHQLSSNNSPPVGTRSISQPNLDDFPKNVPQCRTFQMFESTLNLGS